MSIIKENFGVTENGTEVNLFTLKNKNGMTVIITDFGGAVVSLKAPDRYGRYTDVACGFDSLWDYEHAGGRHGAIIGRVCNRIRGGCFLLDGKEYNLYKNSKGNTLHGGKVGFSHKIWKSSMIDGREPSLVLEYISPDMEEGFPGTLRVKVTYTLTEGNALSINYKAETDRKTIINLTNHTYFNLSGYASGTVLDHTMWIDADSYVATDDDLIPTGEIKSVAGTPFDFREEKSLGQDIDLLCADIKKGSGYDVHLNLSGVISKEPMHRATLYDAKSGREMKIITNEPGIQIYTANFMNEKYAFKGGYPQTPKNAIAIETQKMPDAVNNPNFTDITLDVGEKYDYTTIYQFGVRK